MRVLWPLLVRGVHDAILEDLLDNAERELTGAVAVPNRHGLRIRLVRALVGRRRQAGAGATGSLEHKRT